MKNKFKTSIFFRTRVPLLEFDRYLLDFQEMFTFFTFISIVSVVEKRRQIFNFMILTRLKNSDSC